MRTGMLLAGVVGVVGLAAGASADVLANWTFEVSIPATSGPHFAEAGLFAITSPASGTHSDGGVVYSNPVGNGSLESFSSNFWNIGDTYTFATSTLGFGSITFGFDQTRSSTGPAGFNLDFSLDGSSWTNVTSYTVGLVTWSSAAPQAGSVFGPFAIPAAADNQLAVFFRLIATSAASSTGGTNRVDNVVISGTLVPAPGAIAVLGLAGLVAGRRRRA